MCFFSGSVWAKISATSEKLPRLDPHLLAADRPARVGLRRPRAQVGGVGAGVGLGQAEAAERLARAEPRQPASASAPRCPSARSSRRRARSAPRRRCGPRSRRGRPVRRSARSRGSRGRGRRTLRRPARRGSRPRRACSPARGRSGRRGRSLSTRGAISLSANSRAVSEISCCSSVNWKSISPCSLELAFQARVQRLGECASWASQRARARRGGQLGAVDRGDGLDLARGRGEERLAARRAGRRPARRPLRRAAP